MAEDFVSTIVKNIHIIKNNDLSIPFRTHVRDFTSYILSLFFFDLLLFRLT